MTIQETLLANRPNLSAGSLRTYASILTNIAKQTKLTLTTPDDYITHYKEILASMETQPSKSRKTRLSALVVFCEHSPNSKEAVDAFRTLMMSDMKAVNEENDEQKLSPRQVEGNMSLEEVTKMYKALEKEVAPLWKKDELDKKEHQRLQLYVLLSCLLLIPPRRSLDYTDFKLRNPTDTSNYMIMEKRKPFFVFNVYKTAKKHGQQKIAIPPTLKSIITRWTALSPYDYLLTNLSGNKINSTTIVTMLHSFFGKPLSTSMLRHIFLTDKYKDVPSLKDIKQTANGMAHSPMMALQYVKR
jgi:hypothetical protein